MYLLDARVLDILKSGAAWQKGKIYMPKSELQNLIVTRFGNPRPRSRDIQLAIRRLTRQRLVSWAAVRGDGIVFLV